MTRMSFPDPTEDASIRSISPVDATLTIVIVGALLAVAPFVMGLLQNGIKTGGLPSTAQTSISGVFTQIFNTFNILPLYVVIIALVGILSTMMLLFPRRNKIEFGDDTVV